MSDTPEELAMSKLPEHIEANILTAEDGYRYYWPSGNGMYAAHHLREIADRLDELNGDWDYQIRKFFDDLAAKEALDRYRCAIGEITPDFD